MSGPTVREASADDLEAVGSLYRDLHDGGELADPAALAAAGRALASYPGARLLVAEENGEPVSSCVLFVLPNLSRGARPFGLVENVVTRHDRRNRGFATAVLEHALKVAWEADCYKVMLLTGRTDPAVHRLYRRVGFVAGEKTGYVAYPADGPP
jgi:GNAT superfamily N-acetyltransferase